MGAGATIIRELWAAVQQACAYRTFAVRGRSAALGVAVWIAAAPLHGASDCLLEQNELWGNSEQPSAKRGNGIQLWNTRRNRVLANRIHDKRDGLYLSYADDNTIAGNSIWDTRFGIHYMYSHQNRL